MIVTEDDYISHHGIKGQKWGVRRYQNPDGSLTPEGLRRYANKNLKRAKMSNYNMWGMDDNHNVLYIIGASGSGKSTTALGLAGPKDSVIHIDSLLDEDSHAKASNPHFEKFCKDKGIDVDRARDTSVDIKDRIKVIDKIANQVESYGKNCYSKGNKVVIEGVQLADETMFPDKSYFKDKPVITLHTSSLKSSFRAARRDNKNIKSAIDDFTDKERKEWNNRVEKQLQEIEELLHSDLDELYHHGIKGQKWGVRNGPPYPLGAGGDTIANGNAVRLKDYKGNAYFISQEKLDGKTLNPRVPRNYLTKNGYEDSETPRISFAPTIDQCLAGLSQNVEGNTYYVYQPKDISKCQVYKPNTKAVPDSSITGELWITNPTELTRATKIKVTGNKGTDGKEYSYGDKKAVLFDDWTYEETD